MSAERSETGFALSFGAVRSVVGLQESVVFQDGSANSDVFPLLGGIYQLAAVSDSWGTGSATLAVLGPDDSTFLTVSDAFKANGGDTVYLAEGTYKWLISGAVVSLSILRVPLC